MKKGFTLLEMLIVVVVLAILMGIVFRLSSIGTGSNRRTITVFRLQCLENCLSGYYAAFGSYPPVKYHGSPNPYLEVDCHGIQGDQNGVDIFTGDKGNALAQIEAACRVQPVACEFPFPEGYKDFVDACSAEIKERANNDEYGKEEDNPQIKRLKEDFKVSTADIFDNGNAEEWKDIQLFRFGLMSFLLPRYLVMVQGDNAFYSGNGFAQWGNNNARPSDPFTGERLTWDEVKEASENSESDSQDYATLANIPTQAVCARWMPNLANICRCNRDIRLFGVDIRDSAGTLLDTDNPLSIPLYSPDGFESTTDQYVLDSVTVQDGWGRDFYYHSPPPHQNYVLWSAGANGRTFPPWISRQNRNLSGDAKKQISEWTGDDIIHMSN